MNTEHNKVVAAQFFDSLSAGDIVAALDNLTDDATWLLPGKRESLHSAGLYNKERLARLFNAMMSQLENGLKMTVKSAIGEGDKVALEAESYGELKNGRVYNQQYHFIMEFRDGKICAVREYLDTQHAFAVWFEPKN